MNSGSLLLFAFQIVFLYFLSRKIHTNISYLFWIITKSEKIENYLFAALFLPGTIVHEMAHFLTALVLMVPIKKVALFPKILEGGKLQMGSVEIASVDPIRKFMVSVAPMFFGLFSIFLLLQFNPIQSYINPWINYLILGYLVFTIGNSMFLSKSDIVGIWMFVVLLLVLVYLLYYLGVDIRLSDRGLLVTSLVVFVERSSYFLFVPIIIDTLLIILVKSSKAQRR